MAVAINFPARAIAPRDGSISFQNCEFVLVEARQGELDYVPRARAAQDHAAGRRFTDVPRPGALTLTFSGPTGYPRSAICSPLSIPNPFSR